MAKYRFQIQNYHAIEDASILIDGITVLAGINGCGKSTLSRWLYYVVNTISRYDEIQKKYLIDSLIAEVEKICRFFRATDYFSKYRAYIMSFSRLLKIESNFEEELSEIYTSFSLQIENDLSQYLNDAPPMILRRAYNFILREEADDSPERLVTQYVTKLNSIFQDNIILYHNSISEKNIVSLADTIKNEFEEKDRMPNNLDLFEDGVELFESGSFTEPLMLNNAIYIDTPMALSEHANPYGGSIWGRFRNLLDNANDTSCINVDTKSILQIIRNIIRGNIKLEEDDLGFSRELHYVREDGLDIKIEDTATGIKSFAYILRLVENCWLNDGTILMIDEPEAHLHPQWVVEFARILVLIRKYLGVKILLASHDPDMISAIHDMTSYYKMESETNFYVAKETDMGSGKYAFQWLGHNIAPIFDSFNMAMVKISDFSNDR